MERWFSALITCDGTDVLQTNPVSHPTSLMITIHRTDLDVEAGTVVRSVWAVRWEDGEPTMVRVK